MEINNIDPTQFRDIFNPKPAGTEAAPAPAQGAQQGGAVEFDTTAPKFGGQVNQRDIFNSSTTETTTKAPEAAPTEGQPDASTTDTTTAPPNKDVDILGGDDKGTKGRKPKYNFEDASGYFADRFKTGKLIAMTETLEDGTERDFIPKTPEEFDEVIETQISYKVQEKAKELEQNWYKDKSPAWQAIAKYAEMTDNPAEVIPFMQGVRALESVADLDENDQVGAENIVRIRLQQKGEPDDIIAEQIELLREKDKLVSTAAKYKPMILQEERENLQQMAEARQREQAQYDQLVGEIRDQAVKTIDTPLFGNIPLRREEKSAIYSLIGEPDRETQGYRIFTAIDNLFETRDFETLRQVALLLSNKDTFLGYAANKGADSTASSYQRKIRVANDARQSTGNDTDAPGQAPVVKVQRDQFRQTPRFGR